MTLRRSIAATAVFGSLGIATLGFAGIAQADNHWQPWIPHVDNIVPNNIVPNNPVAPGQLKKWCPWQAPPGQWIGGPHGIPCT